MGMSDDVLCNHVPFGARKSETHQTKSLNACFPGEVYEVTPSGRLELLECTIEDCSDPNAQGWERFAGRLTPVFTGKRRGLNYHGWLEFSGFGRAKLTDGTMVTLEPEISGLGSKKVEPIQIDTVRLVNTGEESRIAAGDPSADAKS